MIKYSHVALIIQLKDDSIGKVVTDHLGIQPTRIQESKSQVNNGDDTFREEISYSWHLDSPKDENFDPTERLGTLMDLIRPVSSKVKSLDSSYSRWIDILFHVTPQHPHGVLGEFDWFRMPAVFMKELGEWNLDVSYESIWFNHPDWKTPKQNIIKKIFK